MQVKDKPMIFRRPVTGHGTSCTRPSPGVLKCNLDAATLKHQQLMSVGVVLCDMLGRFIEALFHSFFISFIFYFQF